MENKHFKLVGYYVGVSVVILVLLAVALFIVHPLLFSRSETSEFRVYMRLFLVMFALNTFAVLRLYNSIVQNTRFSIKLRESLYKIENLIPGLERMLKNLGVAMGNMKNSADSLKKSIDEANEKMDKNNADKKNTRD